MVSLIPPGFKQQTPPVSGLSQIYRDLYQWPGYTPLRQSWRLHPDTPSQVIIDEDGAQHTLVPELQIGTRGVLHSIEIVQSDCANNAIGVFIDGVILSFGSVVATMALAGNPFPPGFISAGQIINSLFPGSTTNVQLSFGNVYINGNTSLGSNTAGDYHVAVTFINTAIDFYRSVQAVVATNTVAGGTATALVELDYELVF